MGYGDPKCLWCEIAIDESTRPTPIGEASCWAHQACIVDAFKTLRIMADSFAALAPPAAADEVKEG